MKFFAEIGLNHLGKDNICEKMVKTVAISGVDGVTVQILDTKYYNSAKNFKRPLKLRTYQKISKFLKTKKKEFGIAVNNIETVDFYQKNLKDISFWKILGNKFYDKNLIKKCLKTKKDVFISTAIASEKEIISMAKNFKNINFIHTTYDNKFENSNILAIPRLKKILNKDVSYGLHSDDHMLLNLVLPLRPSALFFYIKNNSKTKYPDDKHAIITNLLKKKIMNWKKFTRCFGNGVKKKKKIPRWVTE